MNNGTNFVPIALAALVIGGIGIGGLFFWQQRQDQAAVTATSDTSQIVEAFKVCGDPWIGYMPIASDTLQHSLRQKDILFTYEADAGVYAERMQRLREGGPAADNKDGCDFAVATVDANLLNTPDFNRGGVILAVIDQSSGGDAMVCNTEQVPSIDTFTQSQDWKVAFTPDSPSHHLLRAVGNDFGVDAFLGDGAWRIESDGSEAALAALEDGQASCAVLWQPDVSKALKDSRHEVLYSSADADKLIVDVLMVHRDFVKPSSEVRPHVETVLRHYFSALRQITGDDELLQRETQSYLRAHSGNGFSDAELTAMLEGVSWVNLRENGESWFGIGGDKPYRGLEEAHEQTLRLIRAERGKDFASFFRPTSVIDSRLIKVLYEEGVIGERNRTVTDPLQLAFPALSELEWNTLEQQGVLRSRRIVFQSGSLQLEDFSRTALGEAMQDFKRYPKSRLEIQIGYPNSGDVATNRANAQARASVVAQYLIDTFGVDEKRMRVYVPEPIDIATVIPQRDGEGNRAYSSRLRSIQLVLRRENGES